ncbi:MAG TPA: hypothetical protein VNK24_09035 [Elusimicrobiota bacterium]|nr:hypothetical protein [Elusimicrobiota bacterium]
MSELSLASPRCPKCFAQVAEEALTCPQCAFDFAILEQPKPAASAKAAKPAAATLEADAPPFPVKPEIKAKPAPVFQPDLNKEIPFRWSAPIEKTATKKSFVWLRAFMLLGFAAIVSLIGLAGLRTWAVPGAAALVMDAPLPLKPAAPAAVFPTDPFAQRAPSPAQTTEALALAGLFSAQLRAMNQTF